MFVQFMHGILKISQDIFVMELKKQHLLNSYVEISAGNTESISRRILRETLGRISVAIPVGFVNTLFE